MSPNAGHQGSAGAALGRALVTLLIFALLFVAFVTAPLIVLGIAFLIYTVKQRQGSSRSRTPASAQTTAPALAAGPMTAFGAGVR